MIENQIMEDSECQEMEVPTCHLTQKQKEAKLLRRQVQQYIKSGGVIKTYGAGEVSGKRAPFTHNERQREWSQKK